jgi:hypothetical protein
MLFNLRSTVSFLEICRRLKRDIRSGFFEAFSARMFFDSGFEILATPEIQQREDFDFKAVRGVETINVEVTALTASEFSEKTVLSAKGKTETVAERIAGSHFLHFSRCLVVCPLPLCLRIPKVGAVSKNCPLRLFLSQSGSGQVSNQPLALSQEGRR